MTVIPAMVDTGAGPISATATVMREQWEAPLAPISVSPASECDRSTVTGLAGIGARLHLG
ncbi:MULTISPECIES: hypothetical protein [unclassified Rhodococcus (in: high G+C Gram-positive bacteria)]|uniref:hypothetical protein n=1 Tax=Rhodococcus sp. SJ-3 TaxID=3454628 RepID=UPI002DA2B642|nr:hypothetical protein [Rhodococcus sp. (in: high G+C Gram-positive bacteria)]